MLRFILVFHFDKACFDKHLLVHAYVCILSKSSTVQYKYSASHIHNFKFPSNQIFKKSEKKQVKVISGIYLMEYIKNVVNI